VAVALPMNEVMETHNRLAAECHLIPHRLKTVRIGIQATILALTALAVYVLLPGREPISTGGYWLILMAGAMGALVVSLLPWQALFERGLGMWFMYVWSILDIVLITLLIAVSGGFRSELFAVYVLTTVFFAASYPVRGQILLLAFTFSTYLLVIFAAQAPIELRVLILRLSVLGITTFIAGFVSGRLMHTMDAQRTARAHTERMAALMATVARAARTLYSLDYERVLSEVIECARDLGFEATKLCVFTDDGKTFRVAYGQGIPDSHKDSIHDASHGVPGLVKDRKETVIVNYQEIGRPVPALLEAGWKTAIGTPIWLQNHLEAVLVGGSFDERHLDRNEIDAFEMLAALAGRAMENARRFESERRTVRRLEELDRLKSDFISTVSHELRTPLTVVMGAGLTIERRWEEMEPGKRLEMIRVLNNNAEALDTAIATLLDFSQIEAGGFQVRTERISVRDVLDASIERVAAEMSQHDLRTDYRGALEIEADPALIERVAENLLSNAAKHTPAGTRIILSAMERDREVEVAVTDDGPGIPTTELKHVGKRFFRGGHPDRRKTRGVGLGLALVGEILHLHGSHLEIESAPGAGSRFSFRLPISHRATPHLKLVEGSAEVS
jgi:signal transduction histidine kinase